MRKLNFFNNPDIQSILLKKEIYPNLLFQIFLFQMDIQNNPQIS